MVWLLAHREGPSQVRMYMSFLNNWYLSLRLVSQNHALSPTVRQSVFFCYVDHIFSIDRAPSLPTNFPFLWMLLLSASRHPFRGPSHPLRGFTPSTAARL